MISHQRGNLKRHLTSNLAMCFRTTVCVGQLRLNLTIPTVLDIYLILSSPNSGNPENRITQKFLSCSRLQYQREHPNP